MTMAESPDSIAVDEERVNWTFFIKNYACYDDLRLSYRITGENVVARCAYMDFLEDTFYTIVQRSKDCGEDYRD